MSSLIEQAARRLEQIRNAGIAVPDSVRLLPAGPKPVNVDVGGPAAPVERSAVPTALAPVGATPVLVPPVIEQPAPLPVPSPVRPVQTSRPVTLDLDALGASGVVTPNAPRSQAADQYRVIKRPLINYARSDEATHANHGNLIMVTSALVGEGKSFTSVNLAMSIAMELDNTVMLVDADVARPSVLRMLGLPAGPGLLDLLEGHADMSSVLLKTNIDKLTILPSGTPHPQATELLASDAMRDLLDDMARRYSDRIIIFDSPPLLLTTESRVLATQMGQVVMVVQADKTLQTDVQHALSAIKACPRVMMVLNKARGDAAGGYGRGNGKGYGYGYGYGYGAPNETPAA
jgi:protein-tyrosine kinase